MSPGTTQKSVLLFQRREQAEEEEIGFSSRGHFSHLLHPFWSSRVVHPTFRLGKRKLLTIFPIGGYFEAAGVANYRLRLLLTFFLEYFLRQGSSFPNQWEKLDSGENGRLDYTRLNCLGIDFFHHLPTYSHGKGSEEDPMDISTYISKRKRIFKKKDVSGPFVRNSIIPYHKRRVLSRISLPRSFPYYKNGEKGGKYTVSRGGWRIV